MELTLGLLAEITALRVRVDEHERLLSRDSRNSSVAPSNDPPLTRQQRRARDRERAKAQGRKSRGGQPGHEGKGRDLLPGWAVDEVVDHWPLGCGCGHVFCEAELVAAREPARHQVEELPRLATVVTEHRC